MKNIIFVFLYLFCSIITAYSQDKTKRYYEAYKVESPPTIDGELSDDAWNVNEWEGGFVQHEPYEDRPPSQPTEYKICYDDVNLYIAIKAYESSPDSIINRMSRRDDTDGDMVFVGFEDRGDK